MNYRPQLFYRWHSTNTRLFFFALDFCGLPFFLFVVLCLFRVIYIRYSCGSWLDVQSSAFLPICNPRHSINCFLLFRLYVFPQRTECQFQKLQSDYYGFYVLVVREALVPNEIPICTVMHNECGGEMEKESGCESESVEREIKIIVINKRNKNLNTVKKSLKLTSF